MTKGRKPLPEGTIRTKTNGNIQQKRGNKWVYIGCDSELKRKSKQQKPKVIFPPVILPDHIKPTKYPHYYISNDGIAYREPRQCDRNGAYGEINKWGLIQLNTQLRGNPNYGKEFMYEGTNVYLYDENDKNIGNKKKNIHQLVAEAWIPNPHGYKEVLHGKKGNRCNHYTNLRWGTHKENMNEASHAFPEGARRRINGGKGSLYEKKDNKWVLVPSNKPPWNKGLKGVSWNTLPDGTVTTRKVNGSPGQFIKQDGKWVYQKKEKKSRPNGTVTIHSDGKKFIWQDGKWVYQKKKSFPDGTIRTHGKATLKKIDGKWVYQKKEKKKKEKIPKVPKKPLPDGTIRTRSDGTIWIKENGAWVYQKKKTGLDITS